MGIQQLTMDYTGQDNINPRRGAMVTTDDLGTITTAGYLNNASQTTGISFYPTDTLTVDYNGGSGLFAVDMSATGVITLTSITGAGSITGGTSLGGTDAIYAGVSGTNLTFKGLTAGSNITLTPSGTDITIAASGGGSNYEYVNEYWVDTNGSDSNTGTSINEPFATLGQAISVAPSESVINLMGEFIDNSTLTINQNLVFNGPNATLNGNYTINASNITGYIRNVNNWNDTSLNNPALSCATMTNLTINSGNNVLYNIGYLGGTVSIMDSGAVFQCGFSAATITIDGGSSLTINPDCLVLSGSITNSGTLNGVQYSTYPGLFPRAVCGTITIGTDPTSVGSYYALPNIDGSPNEFLKTNGSGVVSWGSPTITPFAYSNSYWVSFANGSDSNTGTSISSPFQTLQHAATTAGTTPSVIYLVEPATSGITLTTSGAGQTLFIVAPGVSINSTFTVTASDTVYFYGDALYDITQVYGTLYFEGMTLYDLANYGGNVYIQANSVYDLFSVGGILNINAVQIISELNLSSSAIVSVQCSEMIGTAYINNDGSCTVNGILGGTSAFLETVVVNQVIDYTGLASAGKVQIVTPPSSNAQYQCVNMWINASGTNFAGGDRTLFIGGNSAAYSTIPSATLLALPGNVAWGDTNLPYPAAALSLSSGVGDGIYAQYNGGFTDYTSGSFTLTLEYMRIA